MIYIKNKSQFSSLFTFLKFYFKNIILQALGEKNPITFDFFR